MFEEFDRRLEAGDNAGAEALLRDALAEAERGGRADTPEYASFLNELAGLYRGQSRFDEAEAAFSRALKIFAASAPDMASRRAAVLLNLAGLYRLQGRLDRALETFLAAKRLLEESGEEGGYAWISVLNNISLVYEDMGDTDSAFAFAAAAKERLDRGGADSHEIATSLNNLAAIRLRAGDIDAAGEYIGEALALYDGMPEENVHHASALAVQGAILVRKREYEAALPVFFRARELTEFFFGKNIDYAVTETNIAAVYEALGDRKKAVEFQSAALAIMEKLLGAEHGRVKNCRARLETWSG